MIGAGRVGLEVGTGVLSETEGAAGGVLWHLAESAVLWASAAEGERGALFLPGAVGVRLAAIRAARVEARVRRPLRRLARGLSEGRAAGLVSPSCGEVAEWAASTGRSRTALTYLEAAAVADPASPGAAYRLGRALREAADLVRAEGWFRESEARARRADDGPARARALIGLGNVHLERGAVPAARRAHRAALRLARRHGAGELEAMASHDLFIIISGSGDLDAARPYAAAALRGYGPHHPRLPSLTHDVACALMDQGEFASSLEVFVSVYPFVQGARERLLTLGSLARAAGGAGDRRAFRRAWRRIRRATEGRPRSAGAAQALLALARGAASLCAWDRAEQAARLALESAGLRRQAAERLAAEALLEEVANARRAATPKAAAPVRAKSQPDRLVRSVSAALRKRAAQPELLPSAAGPVRGSAGVVPRAVGEGGSRFGGSGREGASAPGGAQEKEQDCE